MVVVVVLVMVVVVVVVTVVVVMVLIGCGDGAGEGSGGGRRRPRRPHQSRSRRHIRLHRSTALTAQTPDRPLMGLYVKRELLVHPSTPSPPTRSEVLKTLQNSATKKDPAQT